MKYSFKIDQINSIKWGLNASEALLFAHLFELPSWAEYWIRDGKNFYHASRNKIVLDAPLVSDKPDTIYRLLISLEKKGVIEYEKNGRKDGICFTEKGKLWNSEKNPTLIENSENFPNELGKKSEKTRKKIRENSENFPTNNLISNNSTNTILLKDNSETEVSVCLIEEFEDLKIEVHHVPDYSNEEPEKEKRKSCAKKKKENPDAAPVDAMWLAYVPIFQELSGETPTQHKKYFVALSNICKELRRKATERGRVQPDLDLWGTFLNEAKKVAQRPNETWLKENFTPTTMWSQLDSILIKMRSQRGVVPLYREKPVEQQQNKTYLF